MALGMHRRNKLVETRTTRPTLLTRLRGPNARTRTVKTTTKVQPRSAVRGGQTHTHTHHPTTGLTRMGGNRQTTTKPLFRRRKQASLGDKVSGAMMKLRGGLTNNPREKVCF
jgi:hypothetical protein